MHQTKQPNLLSLACLFLVSCLWLVEADAWTDKITETAYVNSVCQLTPEAQCSWAILIDVQAPGVDMHESSLASARLDRSNFERANFSRSIFQLANLKDTNLMLSNLEFAHMHGVNLQNANLMFANLSGASLFDADLSGADLRGANLVGAILIKAKFDGATWTDGRICAENSIGECR
ncbi:MAG: pentapeptide repeat-containing protein [Candidatus Thiodiazotropha sp.]